MQFNLEVPELLEAQQSLDSLKKDLSKPVVLEVRQIVYSTEAQADCARLARQMPGLVQIYIQPRALHGAANLSSAGKPPGATHAVKCSCCSLPAAFF